MLSWEEVWTAKGSLGKTTESSSNRNSNSSKPAVKRPTNKV